MCMDRRKEFEGRSSSLQLRLLGQTVYLELHSANICKNTLASLFEALINNYRIHCTIRFALEQLLVTMHS